MSKSQYGTLFTVATPIGNLSDITFRAIEVLKSVAVIACEDTRNTKVLCEKYEISTPLVSYHKFSEAKKSGFFVERLKAGEDVALVSDAGTPLVSDPGVKLVEDARLAGINVVPVVGASAVLALLSAISRQGEDFKFIGFLPRGEKQIEEVLKANRGENLVFYESPNRLADTLSVISKTQNDRKMAIGRELTKKFEEIVVDYPEKLLEYYNSHVLKGEIACMLGKSANNFDNNAEIKSQVEKLISLKLTDKSIADVINCLYGTPRNVIKAICLELKNH